VTRRIAADRTRIAAVVPAAGLGTRLLPFTRALPKELLPVGRRTLLDWLATEAIAAGLDELILVTSETKRPFFAAHIEAAARPGNAEDERAAAAWSKLTVRYAIQERPAGLGDAVRVGRDAARADGHDGPVAVLLPDEIHDGGRTMSDLLAVHDRHGGSVLSTFRAHASEIHRYGILELDRRRHHNDPYTVLDAVEKPAAGEAPSHFAIAGRYLLDTAILEALDEFTTGTGEELQLTDAIALVALQGGPVRATTLAGRRFDLGTWDGYETAAAAMR
jgi:UTP--glucose-1-phosphate uridylyltransferase